jgi:hypothetical protein
VHDHEHSDVDIRAIIKYTVILFGALAVVQILLWGVFKLLEGRAERADAALPVSPLTDTTWNTKGPQVQANPVTDRIAFQHREDSVVSTYGWIDKGTGRVRIPIERAIDIVAEQGLPSRNEPYQAMDMGATEPNGGQYQYGGATPQGVQKEKEAMSQPQPVTMDTVAQTAPADTSRK